MKKCNKCEENVSLGWSDRRFKTELEDHFGLPEGNDGIFVCNNCYEGLPHILRAVLQFNNLDKIKGQYLIFAGENHYPRGGISDLFTTVNTANEAYNILYSPPKPDWKCDIPEFEWAEVVDRFTLQVVHKCTYNKRSPVWSIVNGKKVE